jgi:hypothetical protein
MQAATRSEQVAELPPRPGLAHAFGDQAASRFPSCRLPTAFSPLQPRQEAAPLALLPSRLQGLPISHAPPAAHAACRASPCACMAAMQGLCADRACPNAQLPVGAHAPGALPFRASGGRTCQTVVPVRAPRAFCLPRVTGLRAQTFSQAGRGLARTAHHEQLPKQACI